MSYENLDFYIIILDGYGATLFGKLDPFEKLVNFVKEVNQLLLF